MSKRFIVKSFAFALLIAGAIECLVFVDQSQSMGSIQYLGAMGLGLIAMALGSIVTMYGNTLRAG